MEVKKEQIDEVNAKINIKLTTEDLEPKIKKSLSQIKKTAQLKGFRPGKAPLSIIKKMYGQNVMLEELNKMVSETLGSYIKDEKLELLGEPMMSEEKDNMDLDKDKEYMFSFDIGLQPSFDLTLDENIVLTKYKIEVDDKAIDRYVDSLRNKHGRVMECDEIIETTFIKADISETDGEGAVIEDGAKAKSALVSIKSIKDEEVKANFLGMKIDDEKIFDISKVLSGDTEIASTLGIDKEEVANIGAKFLFKVNEISNFEEAELNEDLYNKEFPEEDIKTEEEFRDRVKKVLVEFKEKDSVYKLFIDARNYLIENVDPKLPEEFLKRWLKAKNAEKENFEEEIDREFPKILQHFKWQLILGKIIKNNEIKIEQSEIEELAIEQIKMQLTQYGMPLDYLEESHLKQYANDMILSKQEELNKLYDQTYEDKALKLVTEKAKLKNKKITEKKFTELLRAVD